jgi:regulator of ribonuclease activity A
MHETPRDFQFDLFRPSRSGSRSEARRSSIIIQAKSETDINDSGGAMTNFKTADLCDSFLSSLQIAEPLFQDYGGLKSFCGQIVTVQAFEDNALVRQQLETDGQNRVLVVDGGGSMECALVGDQLAQMAYENGWSGIVINGCIRDSAEISEIAIGLKALNIVPNKSSRKGIKDQDMPVHFAGVTFNPGHYLYADRDGVVIADRNLLDA